MDALLQEFPNNTMFDFDHWQQNLNLGDSCRSNLYYSNLQTVVLPENNSGSVKEMSTSSSGSNSSVDIGDYPNNNVVLKFISDMLMEEDLECKSCMLQESLALQSAEKSFYDVLGQEYPNSSNLSCVGDTGVDGTNSGSVLYQGLVSNGVRISTGDLSGSESEYLGLDVQRNLLRGRKNHQREDGDYLEEEEERSNKHSAPSLLEIEPPEMFDHVLLCPSDNNSSACGLKDGPLQVSSKSAQRKGSNGRSARGKKQGKKGDLVDLLSLLSQCAQAVAISDHRTATELIKQVRQHSSVYGDGNQRMAHYFAGAFEMRLAGMKTPTYTPILSSKTSAAEILKAYQVYVKACPFKRMSNFFANRTIFKLAEKATRLHIIDFGVLYGFQWPCLIQRLSQRPGGPPKLRITGIELPQPGFKPAERVEETARRLERYCKRFNVEFEFSVIAQKWETIKYEDLNIDRNEMTVVNCLYRMKNLPDDTVVANSARDTVLQLIKKIKPDIFIHGVLNGTYNAPFFVTRFKEALFHFSSLFDMFDVNIAREDEQRLLYEREVFGKDIMNVIACEGAERVERPETYKQWQSRNLRAGLRQVRLDQDILKNVRSTVESEYHKDFVVDQDGQWMLQGWKGRVIYALSVWKPVH